MYAKRPSDSRTASSPSISQSSTKSQNRIVSSQIQSVTHVASDASEKKTLTYNREDAVLIRRGVSPRSSSYHTGRGPISPSKFGWRNAPVRKSWPFSPARDAKVSDTLKIKTEIVIPEYITVKEFSEKTGVALGELIKRFIANKMLLSVSSSIDFDTAALVAEDFGIKCLKQNAKVAMEDLIEGNLTKILEIDKTSDHVEVRPPIVTVMWHVDHGKTTLLDYIRKTSITKWEAWGITQSIGWSQILHNQKKITFIDTPWHALFTSLRARGSKITDIVVIVIAADDGIMQQTVEAISHAKEAGVPIIIAITKIDRGIDNTEMIKTKMAEHGLTPEERWGDIPLVKVSGITGEGIDNLLDTILLYAEVSELHFNPQRPGVGVVLEAKKDAKQGISTNMIVMTGTMRVGDILWVHNTFGKIKKIYNRAGKEIKSATGGDPVMVLWVQDVPVAGKLAEVVKHEKDAKEKIQSVLALHSSSDNQLLNLSNRINQGDMVQVKLIMKSDGSWGLDALRQVIDGLVMPPNVEIKVIHADIGDFYESDLDLAKASNGILIGFGTSIALPLSKKAQSAGITVKCYSIIYEIIDYLQNLVTGMIKIELKEVKIGTLKVLQVFYKKWSEVIFGGKVIEWEIRNGAYFKMMDGETQTGSGKVLSLQRGTETVQLVNVGYECGMKAKADRRPEYEDLIDYFVME